MMESNHASAVLILGIEFCSNEPRMRRDYRDRGENGFANSLYGASMASTVTLSSKNQVVIPQEARKKLGVGPGARLLELVKEDRIVFMPEPRSFVKRFSGRHKGVWGKGYLARERGAWGR